MTRDNAREIAVHLIFSLGFGTQSADEVLESELNRERFDELAQEMPVYAQYPNEKQETYIKNLVRGAFVNGILGTFVRAEFQDTPAKPEKVAAGTETAPEE